MERECLLYSYFMGEEFGGPFCKIRNITEGAGAAAFFNPKRWIESTAMDRGQGAGPRGGHGLRPRPGGRPAGGWRSLAEGRAE